MVTAAYDVGDQRRLGVTFTDSAGTLADPTTVTLDMREPDGVVTAWTVTAGQIVKDSTGKYRADWTIAKEGRHVFKWKGTGVVETAEEGEFYARRSGVS